MLQMSKAVRLVLNVGNSCLIKSENNVKQYIRNNFVQCRMASIGTSSIDDLGMDEEKPKKRKTVPIPRITLIGQDQSVRVVFLEEAQKIAKRQNLQLVHVTDNEPKSGRSVYKLSDFHDMLKNENNIVDLNDKKQNFKTTKSFSLKTKIEEHDLTTKITNMNKVLKKNHKIRVIIAHPSGGHAEIIKTLKKNILGTVSEEKVQKDKTILTFVPSSSDENNMKNNVS